MPAALSSSLNTLRGSRNTQEAEKFVSLLKRSYACDIPGHSVCWPLKHGRHLQLSSTALSEWGTQCSTGDATIWTYPRRLEKNEEPFSSTLYPISEEYAVSAYASSAKSRTSFGPISSSYSTHSPSTLSSGVPGPGYYTGKGFKWIGTKAIEAIVAVNLTRTAAQHLRQIAQWQSRFQHERMEAWDDVSAMKMFTILDDVAQMSRPIYPHIGRVRATSLIAALHAFLNTKPHGMPYVFVKKICIPLIILKLISMYKVKSNAQSAVMEMLEIITSTPVSQQNWHCLFAAVAILQKEQLAPPLVIARYTRYLQTLEFASSYEELVALITPNDSAEIRYFEKYSDEGLMRLTWPSTGKRIKDLSQKWRDWENETLGGRIQSLKWEQVHEKELSNILDEIFLLHRLPYGTKAAISLYSTVWSILRKCPAGMTPNFLKTLCGRLVILDFFREYYVLHFNIEVFQQVVITLSDAVLKLYLDTQGLKMESIVPGDLDGAENQGFPTDLMDISERAKHMALSLHSFIDSIGSEMSHRLAESICFGLLLLKLVEVCKSASQLDQTMFALLGSFFNIVGKYRTSHAMDTKEWYSNQNRASDDYIEILQDCKTVFQEIESAAGVVDHLSRVALHATGEYLNITMLTKSSLQDHIFTVGKVNNFSFL